MGEQAEGFELALSIDNRTFRSGDPIVATIVIRNITDVPRFLQSWRQQPQWAYTFVVTRDRSTKIEPRSPGIRSDSFASTRIAPNVSITNQVRLDSLFDLSIPGEYVVTAYRSVPPISFSENQWPPLTNYVQLRSGNALVRVSEEKGVSSSPSDSPAAEVRKENERQALIQPSIGNRSVDTGVGLKSEDISNTRGEIANAVTEVGFDSPRKLRISIIAALLAIVLLIFGRAARRKARK